MGLNVLPCEGLVRWPYVPGPCAWPMVGFLKGGVERVSGPFSANNTTDNPLPIRPLIEGVDLGQGLGETRGNNQKRDYLTPPGRERFKGTHTTKKLGEGDPKR